MFYGSVTQVSDVTYVFTVRLFCDVVMQTRLYTVKQAGTEHGTGSADDLKSTIVMLQGGRIYIYYCYTSALFTQWMYVRDS